MPTHVAEKETAAPKPKKGGKKLDHLRIHHSENGGHIVEHHFEHDGLGPMHEPEKHVFSDGEGGKLLDHIAHHLGVTDTEEQGEGVD